MVRGGHGPTEYRIAQVVREITARGVQVELDPQAARDGEPRGRGCARQPHRVAVHLYVDVMYLYVDVLYLYVYVEHSTAQHMHCALCCHKHASMPSHDFCPNG